MTTSIANQTITLAGIVGFLGKEVSQREMECLLAVAAGQTSKEASMDLGITAGSIDKRLLALTTKLGVTRRAALVAEAFKRGLIAFACTASPSPGNHHGEDSNQGIFLA